jgi:hypothetical protein
MRLRGRGPLGKAVEPAAVAFAGWLTCPPSLCRIAIALQWLVVWFIDILLV